MPEQHPIPPVDRIGLGRALSTDPVHRRNPDKDREERNHDEHGHDTRWPDEWDESEHHPTKEHASKPTAERQIEVFEHVDPDKGDQLRKAGIYTPDGRLRSD